MQDNCEPLQGEARGGRPANSAQQRRGDSVDSMESLPRKLAQVDYWDRVAREKSFTLPLRADWLAKRLDSRARILDLGCGYGRTLGALLSSGYEHVIGMDFSAGMLGRCRTELPAAILARCDGRTIPLRAESTHAVLLLAVLTCTPADADQQALIDEIQRVLRPGGMLYISDFLLNEDARNRERYERSRPEGGDYGVFCHAEGVVVRHHREEWIAELTGSLQQLEYEPFWAVTMNGNRSAAFQYLGRKAGR